MWEWALTSNKLGGHFSTEWKLGCHGYGQMKEHTHFQPPVGAERGQSMQGKDPGLGGGGGGVYIKVKNI